MTVFEKCVVRLLFIIAAILAHEFTHGQLFGIVAKQLRAVKDAERELHLEILP